MLRGTRELAEQVFDLPARVGAPERLTGLQEIVDHPRFATGVGLLHGVAGVETGAGTRSAGSKRLAHSFGQLKRAIASLI